MSKTRASCVACTIGCEHIYSLGPEKDDTNGVRLEYENLFALGPLCGVGDPAGWPLSYERPVSGLNWVWREGKNCHPNLID